MKLRKLDLGCGQNKKEGFYGVDKYRVPGVDKVCDLMKFPWPFKAESVEEIHSSHFFEHIPGLLRGKFMDEVWRVLIPGGKATIIVPYAWSSRSVQDFTHQWPPVCEQSFLYFNKKWREDNKLGHYLCSCDFDFTYGYALDNETAAKNHEAQLFHVKHYIHAVADLQVTLTKRTEGQENG